MSEEVLEINEDRGPRPGFLTVLCVLTFISTGMGLISGLVNLVLGPSSEEAMLESKVEMTRMMTDLKDVGLGGFADTMEQLQAMTEQVNDNFYLASFITLITVGLGLFGTIRMFKGVKSGFHMYIIYCLLSVAAIYIYVSAANIPNWVIIFNLVFSGLFIFMYSRNLKWMR